MNIHKWKRKKYDQITSVSSCAKVSSVVWTIMASLLTKESGQICILAPMSFGQVIMPEFEAGKVNLNVAR